MDPLRRPWGILKDSMCVLEWSVSYPESQLGLQIPLAYPLIYHCRPVIELVTRHSSLGHDLGTLENFLHSKVQFLHPEKGLPGIHEMRVPPQGDTIAAEMAKGRNSYYPHLYI